MVAIFQHMNATYDATKWMFKWALNTNSFAKKGFIIPWY